MLPKSKKLRVIVNRVHFYSTVGAIRAGVGDLIALNDALQVVLHALEYDREVAKKHKPRMVPTGIATVNRGFEIQLDILG